MSHDMPCGSCCVCGEELDFSEAGVCGTCGQAFCWSHCGGWSQGRHECKNCKDVAASDAEAEAEAERYDEVFPTEPHHPDYDEDPASF